MTDLADTYLVWSHEHSAWWRPDERGYTIHLMSAGRYSRKQAIEICAGAHRGWRDGQAPSEIPVRLVDVMEFTLAHADGESGDKEKAK